MAEDRRAQFEAARRDRGAQLRALVVSWAENKTFVEVLRDQQQQIDEGKFQPNEDWNIMADEILGAYASQSKMTDWDDATEPKQPAGPKLIIP